MIAKFWATKKKVIEEEMKQKVNEELMVGNMQKMSVAIANAMMQNMGVAVLVVWAKSHGSAESLFKQL